MANLEIVSLETGTPQLRAPATGDGYLAPRTLNITPEANTSALTASSYSLTGSNAQSLLDLAGTWNTTGTPTALKLNVTDTASNAASLLMDLQVGGTSQFRVTKAGALTFAGNLQIANNAVYIEGTAVGTVRVPGVGGYFGFTTSSASSSLSTIDTFITRDAAGVLAQRNGANAQTFRIYNTADGSPGSNFERGKISWSSNVLQIGTEKGGTGTARALELQTDGTTRLTIGTTGITTFSGNQYFIHDSGNATHIMRGSPTGNPAIGFQQSTTHRASISYGTANGLGFYTGSPEPGTLRMSIGLTGGITIADANNIAVDTTTGTKIGTGTTQKLAFWDATPIVQPINSVAIDTLLVDTGLRASGGTANFASAIETSSTIKTGAPTGGTAAAWKLGAVATVSPTSPNRTIEVDIGGTIYYLHAKTTND